MAADHPSGEVRPVIVRDVLDATETQGASVGMRFCAASVTGFVPPEPCQSLRNGGSSACGAGKWGIPAKTHLAATIGASFRTRSRFRAIGPAHGSASVCHDAVPALRAASR
jgi:hypothetical protein